MSTFDNTDDMFINAEEVVKRLGLAKAGDNIVITAGVPLGKNVGTNLIKVGSVEEFDTETNKKQFLSGLLFILLCNQNFKLSSFSGIVRE